MPGLPAGGDLILVEWATEISRAECEAGNGLREVGSETAEVRRIIRRRGERLVRKRTDKGA